MQRQVVSFHYVLRDEAGEVVDASSKENPITFLEGSGMIIDGLEKALHDMAVGEQREVSLEPEDAYGAYDERQVQEVDRSVLPVDEVKVGDMFQAGQDRHSPIVRVIEVTEEKVKLDANHPMAGKRLFFDVEVVEKRDATEEEIAHGHVHGPGGHQH